VLVDERALEKVRRDVACVAKEPVCASTWAWVRELGPRRVLECVCAPADCGCSISNSEDERPQRLRGGGAGGTRRLGAAPGVAAGVSGDCRRTTKNEGDCLVLSSAPVAGVRLEERQESRGRRGEPWQSRVSESRHARLGRRRHRS
jgi:hypothetical protein